MSDVKYPDVSVRLSGEDGNIFFISGRVQRALRDAGVSNDDIEDFATLLQAQPSYDHALRLVMRTVKTS